MISRLDIIRVSSGGGQKGVVFVASERGVGCLEGRWQQRMLQGPGSVVAICLRYWRLRFESEYLDRSENMIDSRIIEMFSRD